MAKDVFTEDELPRGKMMLVGRSLNGHELGCIVNPEIESHMNGEIFKDMLEALKNTDNLNKDLLNG